MLSTIIQWTLIIGAIAGYIFYAKHGSLEKATAALKAKASGGAANLNNLLDVDTSSTEKSKKRSGTGKSATTKKDKKQKSLLSQAADAIPKVTLASSDDADVPDGSGFDTLKEDKDSLQRLLGLKASQGKTSGKSDAKSEKKQAVPAASKAKSNQSNLIPAPVSPSLGAMSSTSSTTGADADIDEPDSVDEFGESGYEHPVGDMLETTSGPSVLRITPSNDAFTTVTRKSRPQVEKKESLTSLQKKNLKKNEAKKELKKLEHEEQVRRLEAHKKDQRLAKEAEARKNPKQSQAPASNAWSASNTNSTVSAAPVNVTSGFLDTFDPRSSKDAITPSSSDADSHSHYGELSLSEDQKSAIPPEVLAEYLAERGQSQQAEQEWVEVKKPRKDRKKSGLLESETDSDAFKKPATPVPQAVPKKESTKITNQDLRIPAMPAMDSSNGWEAHAW